MVGSATSKIPAGQGAVGMILWGLSACGASYSSPGIPKAANGRISMERSEVDDPVAARLGGAPQHSSWAP
jgi:hypothetical protein